MTDSVSLGYVLASISDTTSQAIEFLPETPECSGRSSGLWYWKGHFVSKSGPVGWVWQSPKEPVNMG